MIKTEFVKAQGMTEPGHREELLNIILAQMLCDLGIVADPERILQGFTGKRSMPDVMVEFAGLRIIIEGKIGGWAAAARTAFKQAQERVDKGLAHIGVAVVYPKELRHAPFASLYEAMKTARLQVALVSESTAVQIELFPDLAQRPQEAMFWDCTSGDLADLLRQAFDHLVKEDAVKEAVAILEAGVESFFVTIGHSPALIERIATTLNIPIPEREQQTKFFAAVCRITALILLNSIVFQEVLAQHNSSVKTLRQVLASPDPLTEFTDHWEYIIAKINYYPIFNLAIGVVRCMPSDASLIEAIGQLVHAGQRVIRLRAALSHDLMGRIYHRWLLEAKYLGAYYTKISSAILLMKLALRQDGWSLKWHENAALETMRIADLACGTGTLLMASANVLTDIHVRAANANGKTADLEQLHKIISERVLYGYDVVASALHITAATLAMRNPAILLNNLNLFGLPLGGLSDSLGSLEFLGKADTPTNLDLFSTPVQVNPDGEKKSVKLPALDLCVMNPPFVRSVVGNLLFGSLPPEDRPRLQRKLKRLTAGLPASITAGLGSVFVALGDQHLKPGGRLALVLPKAVLSGIAWAETRRLLSENYSVEYMVSSHEPYKWNFSESTNLSEVLLVARKNEKPAGDNPRVAVAINLWKFPETTFEALALSSQILNGHIPDLETEQGALSLFVGTQKFGEAVGFSWQKLRTRSDWLLPCGFAQIDLARVLLRLMSGELWIPGYGFVGTIPMTRICDLGSLGPDQRDVVDGFDTSPTATNYRALWGHDASQIRTISTTPNTYLYPLPQPRTGRHLRKADDLWPKSSRLMIPAKLRFNTSSVIAVRLDYRALGVSWWPLCLNDEDQSERIEKALVLWLNSTLGLFLVIGHRVEQVGAWVNLKKPTLHSMPVLDPHRLTTKQLSQIEAVYDEFSSESLLPLPFMVRDPVRQKIDSSLVEILGMKDISVLREMLAREPNICLEGL